MKNLSMSMIQAFIQRVLTSAILGASFWLSFIYLPPFYFSFILSGILAIIIFFEWNKFFKTRQLSYWLIMPFYPILPFALLIFMNQNPHYHQLLFSLFISVASMDTGSYILGTLIGRHKIAPSISPNKTWEGFIGGYILATFMLNGLIRYEWSKSLAWYNLMSFSLIICSLALLGDLFESWLKRHAGIKDSGTALPGHGGFLDRFDGIMFAVFFFFIFKDRLISIVT